MPVPKLLVALMASLDGGSNTTVRIVGIQNWRTLGRASDLGDNPLRRGLDELLRDRPVLVDRVPQGASDCPVRPVCD